MNFNIEQGGNRYNFTNGRIYRNEVLIASGLTAGQWSAIKYNPFNDTTQNVYALNGTDRKRIESSTVYEWGIAAPTTAPTLTPGQGTGLTGDYNVKYTYARKSGDTLIAESDGSDAATTSQILDNQSLLVDVDEAPSDSQVTHIRLYRTLAGGSEYFLDQELAANITWAYGYVQTWEKTDAYIAGTGFNFTITDSVHSTEDCYSWELTYEDRDDDEDPELLEDDYALNTDPDYKSYWDDV